MKLQLEKFCEYFYAAHYVPIALYNGLECVFYYSSLLDKQLDLSARLMPLISSSDKNPDVFTLPEQGHYGLININGQDKKLLVGPVFSNTITQDTVLAVARNNFIASEDFEILNVFLSSIPRYSYNQFMNLIAYVHYSINHEAFDVINHFYGDNEPNKGGISETHVENFFAAKETQKLHGTYDFENILLSYVRDGEVAKLKQFLLHTAKQIELTEGILADTPLRQAKNLMIGTATMVGKIGAIGGGMDVEETYRLLDSYIQECEKTPSVEDVKLLQYNMILDFTQRVSQSKIPKNTSKEIFECMQFIQNHTSYSIGINDVAEHIGRSRSFITKKFREEINMSITDFITQCKMKDAKRLLRYSNKSLCEISSYLSFSSQAYFQTVFKQNTGMTPNEYRQKHR